MKNNAVDRIKLDPKHFFRYAKKFSNLNHDIGPLLKSDSTSCNKPDEISEILSNQFQSVFSVPMNDKVVHDHKTFFN